MSASLSPAVRTVLQLLQARQMFIGDELRVSALRVAWTESGHAAEDFGHAISELKRLGYARTVHGTAGPAIQLTHAGFRASTEQPKRVSPAKPMPAPRRAAPAPASLATRALPPERPLPAATPPPRRERVSAAPPPAQPETPAATPASRSDTDHELAHAQVFRTRSKSLNDNVLRYCLLGLFEHHRLRPDGKLGYDTIMGHWSEMGLTRSDLLYALEILIRRGEIRTTTKPQETVILTKKGYNGCRSTPESLEQGMDRWQAKKRLRLTKQLGSLPAA